MPITEEHLLELLEKESFSELIKKAVISTQEHPESAVSWKALGLGLYKNKNFNGAIKALRKASMLLTTDAEVFKALGFIAQSQNKKKQAKTYFDYVVKINPTDVEMLNIAGLLNLELDDPSQAVNCFEQLLKVNPNCFNTCINLATAYKENKDSNKFRLTLIQAEKIPPTTEEEWAALAEQWIDSNYANEGKVLLSKLININPDNNKIPYLKGVLAAKNGSDNEAIKLFKQSLALFPNQPKAAVKASLLLQEKDLLSAIKILKEALTNNPNDFNILQNLCMLMLLNEEHEQLNFYINRLANIKKNSVTYIIIGNYNYSQKYYGEAILAFEKSLKLDPKRAGFISDYANALIKDGQLNKAITTLRKYLPLQPGLAGLLGTALYYKGENKEAVQIAKKITKSKNSNTILFSNYLFYLLHSDSINNKNLFKEHLKYGSKFESAIKPFSDHTNLAFPDKKLKIGFVSGDMYNHAVAYFAAPIFKNLDKEQFELSVFYSNTNEDHVTEELKSLVEHWFDVSKIDDGKLSKLIKDEGIDILIDLSGHTGLNRLTAFAYKPAPIQITAIGYGYTTGLKAMDYTFVSSLTDNIENQQKYWTEKFIIYPHKRLAVRPQRRPEALAPSKELPVYKNNYFTYGSLNRFSKISKETLGTWATILQLSPTSKLLLGNIEKSQVKEVIDFFKNYSISANRLILKPRISIKEYMFLFNQIDLILDTWPFGGGTTTNDALSMGVTVLALKSQHPVHAMHNATFLSMELDNFLVDSIDDYITTAVGWTEKLEELQAIRIDLLNRPELTAVEDEHASYLNWNKGLRMAWQRWCAGSPVESFTIDI